MIRKWLDESNEERDAHETKPPTATDVVKRFEEKKNIDEKGDAPDVMRSTWMSFASSPNTQSRRFLHFCVLRIN